MINVDKLGAYYFPLDKKPRGQFLTLELYSELSLSSIVFDEIGGEVLGDYFLTTINSGMTEQISNGEYNYTLYDNVDGEKVGIGLIRFDLEEEGDTEYEVYEDFFDGFVQAIELEATGFTENGTYKVGEHQNGWNEVTVNVPLESTGFTENGTYVKSDGGWNEVEVNIDTDFYVQSGYTSGYTDGYSSGYTDGYVDGQGETLNYFYFRSREDGSKVSFSVPTESAETINLEYSFDKMQWQTWNFSNITLNSGETVYFRGDNPSGLTSAYSKYVKFVTDDNNVGRFDIGGDLRSLLDKTISITAVPCNYCFNSLFSGNNIVNVEPNLLSGFKVLKDNCFFAMFRDCKHLLNAPELPFETLTQYCYYSMFEGASSLTTAPELPAKTLVYVSYNYMFRNCSSLNYVKCLASNNLRYANHMLEGVAETGVFVKDYTVDWSGISLAMPSGWTVKSEVELISTAITSNGTFTAETGQAFTAVTVDVPISSYRYPTDVSSALTPYHLTQEVWISPNTNTASVYNWFEGFGTGATYNICAFYISVHSGDTIYGMKVGNYNDDDWANIDTFYWMDGSTSTIFTGVYLSHQFTKNYTGWMGIHRNQGNGSGYLSNLGNIGDYAVAMAINDNYEIDNQNAAILTGKTFKFGKMDTQTGFVG